MGTGSKAGREERGSDSERRGAMMGSASTGRRDGMGSGADEGAMGSINGGEEAMD